MLTLSPLLTWLVLATIAFASAACEAEPNNLPSLHSDGTVEWTYEATNDLAFGSEPMIVIHDDGTVDLNGQTVDEASALFWKTVEQMGMDRCAELKRRVLDALEEK